MNATDLLQRLQHNPGEAVLVYPASATTNSEGRAWIINRQGIIAHKANVDHASTQLADEHSLRFVACQVSSQARIYRPKTDFQP